MHRNDALLLRLNLIENVVLDAVHTADWEKLNGNWRPIPLKHKEINELPKNWRVWQEEWKELTVRKWDDQVSSMIENVGRAVDFDIYYSGSQSNRWRVIFEYKQAFCTLYEKAKSLLNLEDEEFQFRKRYEDEFAAFTADHGNKVNIFVAIEYSEADEVSGIVEFLKNLQYSVATPFQIHFAKDRAWVGDLHTNLVFYMIACQAGMAFFTSANFREKKSIYNPNVIYEFGFMRGLGKKCKMFVHGNVKETFTDVKGLLYEEYTTLNQAKDSVKRFLKQEVGISFRPSAGHL